MVEQCETILLWLMITFWYWLTVCELENGPFILSLPSRNGLFLPKGHYCSWLVVWNMFYVAIQLGISSSQLTNSNLFQRGGIPTTNQIIFGYINHLQIYRNHILTIYKPYINHILTSLRMAPKNRNLRMTMAVAGGNLSFLAFFLRAALLRGAILMKMLVWLVNIWIIYGWYMDDRWIRYIYIYVYTLVGGDWNMFLCSHIFGMSSSQLNPIDELIFFRGVFPNNHQPDHYIIDYP